MTGWPQQGKTGNLVINFSKQGRRREFKEFNKNMGKHIEFRKGREMNNF